MGKKKSAQTDTDDLGAEILKMRKELLLLCVVIFLQSVTVGLLVWNINRLCNIVISEREILDSLVIGFDHLIDIIRRVYELLQ